MDDYLFILLAKLKADRLNLAREQGRAAAGQQDLFAEPRVTATHHLPDRSSEGVSGGAPGGVPVDMPGARWFPSKPDLAGTNLKERVMKGLIALAASIVVNAGVLGALEHNVYVAQTPEGHVYVTELGASKAMPTYAQADSESRPRSL